MAANDPFYSLKAEVETAVKQVSNTHGKPLRAIEDALQRIGWDIEMLQESIDRVEGNQAKFGISTEELESRKGFVRDVKAQVNFIRAETVEGSRGTVKEQRESLLGKNSKAERQAAASAAIEDDNERFLEGENLRQALLIQEQDDTLDDLGKSVARIGEMSLNISSELKEQESIIDDLNDRTDYTVNNMDDVNKMVASMLKSKEGRNQICLIIMLTLGLITVTTLIFILP